MWAFAKSYQLRGDLLVNIAMSKSSLISPDADTPIRRPADTLPLATLRQILHDALFAVATDFANAIVGPAESFDVNQLGV